MAEALRAQGFEVEFIEIQSLEDMLEAEEKAEAEDKLPDLLATDIPDTLNIAEWEKLRRGEQSQAEDAKDQTEKRDGDDTQDDEQVDD